MNKTCIYCKQTEPTKFKGVEHVVPQAFGKFGVQTPTLDCVCDDCNEHFGKNHDIYLARETVEGISRYKQGIFSSAARPQKHLNIVVEDSPEAGQFAGMKVAIDGTKNELMKPKAQFKILNQRTGKNEVYFLHQLDSLNFSEEAYGKPGDGSAIKGTWECFLYAFSEEDQDEMIQALRARGINFIPGARIKLATDLVPDADGKGSLPVEIEGEIGLEHRQAHAKILMNFIARYLGCGEALKPEWDFLRGYARYGNGLIKYIVTDPPPREQDDELRNLTNESIVIRLDNIKGHICGQLRFYGNHTYTYVLRENAALPDECIFGFLFTEGKEPALLMLGRNVARMFENAEKSKY